MIRTLLLFGATGDLSRRFLLPALEPLGAAGRLPAGFRVVPAGRDELEDPSKLQAALGGGPVAAYLAVPPAVFGTAIETLATAGLPAGSRVVVEKPFGEGLESAEALNELAARTGIDAYRVDHVLGMETTRRLLALRRAGTVLERLWSGEHVEQVEILWEETLALEGRAGYYDRAGALVDVLQSHMLQLLALVAMEPPADDDDVQARKLDVLRSVRLAESRRARYTAGRLADGRDVPAYAEEEGVDPVRGTETFAEVTVELDHPRWRGTQFVLRAGKALPRRRKLALLRFRSGGELEIGIDGPEDTVLRVPVRGDPLELRAPAHGDRLPAYANVLLDVLGGTSALSVSGDEAEQAWRVVAPVLAAWRGGDVPLEEYAAGSQPA